MAPDNQEHRPEPVGAAGEARSSVQIRRPSDAHKENVSSVVYRLSEVMFGSLLASYVIGFLAASAQQSAAFHDGSALNSPVAGLVMYYITGGFKRWWPPIIAVDYLLISIAFAFLTAASYVIYQAGVLTLPQLSPRSLGMDFGIALSQAVLFGISILVPEAFVFSLGIFFVVALARKQSVSQGFESVAIEQTEAAFLDNVRMPRPGTHFVGPKDAEPIDAAKTRCADEATAKIREAVKKKQPLEVWRAPTKRTWAAAVGLCLLGVIAILLSGWNIDAMGNVKQLWALWLLLALPVVASGAAIVVGFRELGRKGGFLTGNEEGAGTALARMDDAVEELEAALSEIAGGASTNAAQAVASGADR